MGSSKYVLTRKLIRIKYTKKSSKLRTEITNDEKIEKDLWKFCKDVFESENQVLTVFDEKTWLFYQVIK